MNRPRSIFILGITTLVACASVETNGNPTGGSATANGGHGGTATTDASGTTTNSSTSASGSGGGGGTGGALPRTVANCYADDFVNPPNKGTDYDQFSPVVASHCMGTDHQDITGIQRVVFLGDSVTVGSPPTFTNDFYRVDLAKRLAQKFGLSEPNGLWQNVNLFDGKTYTQDSGAFASCSRWGARTDDLAEQLSECFPANELGKTTLVVMTMGGNDISSLTQDAIDGVSDTELWAKTEGFVQLMRETVDWLKAPNRFPNGISVIYGNMYEFTDGTGEVDSCDVSGLAGFDEPVPSPDKLADMVIWANEQYVKIAVDYAADIIFMLEDFCGHGFQNDNPSAPCYRGAGTERWFDMTCIHPNPAGHKHIADMFMAVVEE